MTINTPTKQKKNTSKLWTVLDRERVKSRKIKRRRRRRRRYITVGERKYFRTLFRVNTQFNGKKSCKQKNESIICHQFSFIWLRYCFLTCDQKKCCINHSHTHGQKTRIHTLSHRTATNWIKNELNILIKQH